MNEPLLLTALLTPTTWCLFRRSFSSDTSWVSCLSIWSWHCQPGVNIRSQSWSVPQDCPHFRCQWPVPGCPQYCRLTGYQFENFPQPPPRVQKFSRLIHRTQKRALLLLPVYYEGYNSEAAKWKRYMGWGLGRRGTEAPSIPMCSSAQKLSEPHLLGVFMEVLSPFWG